MSAKKPNFFIIGAPKCGTTALSRYLQEHPDVYFSSPKEPDYFNVDYSNRKRSVFTEEEYLNQCFSGSASYKAVGEGSVRYLHSKVAVPNILEFNPRAKFIVMVRNPVDMFHSLYTDQALTGLWEDAKTPEEAWRLQESRAKSRNIPKFCPDSKLLQYGEVCKTGEQIERLYKTAPKENILLIFYDDFKEDTKEVYRDVLQFLDLPDDGREEFSPVNTRKATRFHLLNTITRQAGVLARKMGIKRNFGVRSWLKKINTKTATKKETLSPEFKKELLEYFEEDIAKLEELTGRDLSAWRKV